MRYELRSDPNNEFAQDLWRVDEDGTETCLGTDEMEIEDVMFGRDMAWVPVELNRLAHILELTSMRSSDLQEQNKLLTTEIAHLREAQALWEAWFDGLKAFIAARWPPDEGRVAVERSKGGGLTEQP